MIYAIEAIGLDLIKIGKAKNPETRLRQLQTGSPAKLRLLAVVAADDLTEGMIHRRFSGVRRVGEWFEATEEIADFVCGMTAGIILPGSERRKDGPCPVCEAYRAANRERVARWRAKKP